MHELSQRFVDALHHLHADRDAKPIADLFGDDAALSKLDHSHEEHGPDGAKRFWQTYREVFDAVEATFTHTVESDDTAVLEWTSEGTLSDGAPFSYRGVSVLEGGGGTINAFRTYYDSAAFLRTAASS